MSSSWRVLEGVWLVILTHLICCCARQAPLHARAVELNRAGVDALQNGDLSIAEARFALALEYHPRFVDGLVNLAIVEMQRGNFSLARTKLEKAVAINRHLAQPHHGLGVLSEREGHFARAADHYRAALEVDPGFAPSRANLARLHFVGGQLDHAREQFLRLSEIAPDQPAGYVGLVESLLRLGRDTEANQVLDKAVKLLGDVPEIRLYRARWALRDGHYTEADSLLSTMLDGPPILAGASWAWLGLSQLLRHDAQRAIACAQRALVIDRDDALATYVLAMALSHRRDRDAKAWLERAAMLAPGDSVIRFELTQIQSRNTVSHEAVLAQ